MCLLTISGLPPTFLLFICDKKRTSLSLGTTLNFGGDDVKQLSGFLLL